jgi:hypothetical protein
MNAYLRHGQAGKSDLLVIVEKRQIFQKGFGLKDHFVRVRGQNPLIEALNGRKGRLIAEKQLNDIQTFDMPRRCIGAVSLRIRMRTAHPAVLAARSP